MVIKMQYEKHKELPESGGESKRAKYIIVKATHWDGTIDYRLFGYDWNPQDLPEDAAITFYIWSPTRAQEQFQNPYVSMEICGHKPEMQTVTVTGAGESSTKQELVCDDPNRIREGIKAIGIFPSAAEAETAMAELKVIQGCREPNASNYNPKANYDGTCNYDTPTEIPWGMIAIAAAVVGIVTVI